MADLFFMDKDPGITLQTFSFPTYLNWIYTLILKHTDFMSSTARMLNIQALSLCLQGLQ